MGEGMIHIMEYHEKIWGKEKWICNNEKYCCKILYLKKGYRCSYHYHKLKDETFYILKGRVLINVNYNITKMKKESIINIWPKTKHAFAGIEDSIILEISTQHFEEDSYRENKSGVYNNDWNFKEQRNLS